MSLSNMEYQSQLVSVFILTYNSANYIVEALNSVKSQSYQNIELVVSDDGSNDMTVPIVKEWLSENANRFVRTEVVETLKNTGTSANYNRAVKACHGEWLKMLDGDDKLLPEAISEFVDYIREYPSSSIVVGKVRGFGNVEAIKGYDWLNTDKYFLNLTRQERTRLLLEYNFIPSASVFISRQLYDSLDGFDEEILLIEDWPFWLKAAHRGYNFDYLPSFTAEYRFSTSSISQVENQHSSRYMEDYKKSLLLATRYMCDYGLCGRWYGFTKATYLKKKGFFSFVIYKTNLLNPFWWKQRKLLKKVRSN